MGNKKAENFGVEPVRNWSLKRSKKAGRMDLNGTVCERKIFVWNCLRYWFNGGFWCWWFSAHGVYYYLAGLFRPCGNRI
jgi:hypothetical protein